jgi:Tol biopolymer transport system component
MTFASRRTLVGLAAALALVSSACTWTAGEATTSTPPVASTPPSSASPDIPAGAVTIPGTLLIRDLDGNLVTLRPDGTERLTLAVAAEGEVELSQAAWAPDGTRVAWGQLDQLEGSVRTQVVTSAPGGGERTAAEVPFLPFYLAWDPTSRHVAYLGNQGDGVGLGVVEEAVGEAPNARSLDEGQPYYFAWSPAGDRLLIHEGDDRLEELDLEGGTEIVDERPGVFQAPAWSPDGLTQLYVRRGGGLRQTIVARLRGRDRAQDLVPIVGAGFMVLSPDGQRMAFQALSPDELDLYDRDLPERVEDVGVTVVDLDTGRAERISTDVAAAWYWSPDGTRLAILEPVYDGDGPISFRWRVWDGTSDVLTPTFTASLPLLQETTPFFSQFAQSWSMWAPDGSAFAFPLDLPGAVNTIVVQPVDPDLPPYTVGRGTFVAWSPV